jgi:hypothetical protein
MLILRNSPIGRLSTISTFSPVSSRRFNSAAAMCGVSQRCSTSSPNALLGTLTPVKSS